MLIVNAPDAPLKRAPDAKLVALLARATDWAGRLTSGRCKSIQSIAEMEKATGSYVTRVTHLAFLAPDLILKISQGEQPPTLNATWLLGQVPLPLDWIEQRRLLGFSG